jgi:hypothetical protein
MSKSSKDAKGGHYGFNHGIGWGESYENGINGKRWAKRFTRREARREHRATTAAAVMEFYEDIELDQRQATLDELDADWYDPDDDVNWYDTDENPFDFEYDYAYDPYQYDPYQYDPFNDDSDHLFIVHAPDLTNVSTDDLLAEVNRRRGHNSLYDLVEEQEEAYGIDHGQSLGELLQERNNKK